MFVVEMGIAVNCCTGRVIAFSARDVGRHREVFVVLIGWMNLSDVHVDALRVVLSPMVM
jgi:hypothetical protein